MVNYHDMALTMGSHDSFAIFRQFRTANVRNLLLLQAEIINANYQLGDIIQKDRNSGNPKRSELETNVLKMQNYEDEGGKSLQWEKLMELRALLKEYNQTLLQVQTILCLPPASPNNLAGLRDWLHHAEGGNSFLEWFESKLFDETSDLTSLTAVGENKDVISKWIDGPFISWFYHKIGHRVKDHSLPIWDPTLTEHPRRAHLDFYPGSGPVVTTISTVFASTLPTLSIFALYYIKSPVVRLGMITLFTCLFSLILTVFTNAKRSDCFSATAAFAAVNVVFVGSTTNGSNMSPST